MTLRDLHNECVYALSRMKVPPSPDLYDNHGTRAWLLEADVAYLRQVLETVRPVFERVANDAADNCNVRIEHFALLEGALGDYTAPLTDAIEEQLEAATELRAERSAR